MKLPEHCFVQGEPYAEYIKLSNSRSNITIIDIGTYRGFSAVALASNKTNMVHSFDIGNYIEIELPFNVQFTKTGALQIPKSLLREASIILLDVDPHDGKQEPEIFKYIKASGFKGIVIADDVNFNQGMKDWFNSVTEKKELANWHHTGTGIIYIQ